ncbi:DUF551 domain-containing protein [Klebsiella pneumoniae]|uniref:DUF551 domain-containing protein n=1 Tax=Klebsiella pneumoniae TaxID=573 RepID=UPI000E2CB174|nr:DUF551 domain-containing protein [Klebsiella pneumoniae]MCA5275801.1 DUF551 domain-containing protein [Klebsiella pneumoniae]MCA5403148.1 DUF551 domain-containing protein [Klebsiella pneumoniae]MCF0418359.1 DUF551 domain-containing protein [Klebsiella pneumoniae]MDE1573373.1 DUF551 domain-containing protein [Klebsiella pneumoniae]WHE66459.1 DUF551 domain-containing protein [Klebsiella pneumoniae]
MTKSTITREQLEEWVAQFDEDGGCDATDRQLEALIRQSLAAMDSEPVAFIFKHPAGRLFWSLTDESNKGHDDVMPVYAAPQPAMVAPVCTCPSGDGSLRWPCPVHPGNSPAQSDCCPAQNCIHSAQGVDRPVAWHHTAKSKEGNHGTCCFSYASSHDFGPRYEKPQSQPHYLPERLDYDRALHFLSTEPRKVTPETVIGGNSPVIPDGSADMLRRWLAFGRGMQNAGCQLPHNLIVESEAMLAAAQHDTPALNPVQSVVTVPGKWIPVSERMPELGDWLVTDGCDFDVQLFNGEQFIPGFVWEDKITHWMPLPAVPQEVKGE